MQALAGTRGVGCARQCTTEPRRQRIAVAASSRGDLQNEASTSGRVQQVLNHTIAALLSASLLLSPLPADAVLSSPNAKIARTPEAALRRSIPKFNARVAEVQASLEDVAFLLRIPQRKPWGSMSGDVDKALAVVGERGPLLEGVRPEQREEAENIADTLFSRLKQLELAIKTQDPDRVSIRTANALEAVSDLKLLQAPGLPFLLPKDYQGLPRLVGRAVVELQVEKKDGSLAFVDGKKGGGSTKRGKVLLTLDGYSAPITAGNFMVNVLDGVYNNRQLQVDNTSVLVPHPRTSRAFPPVPLEILPLGAFEPVYRSTLDVQGGELPVLPLSITGALAMGHVDDASGAYVSGDEWFVFKFSKSQAGLSGLAFDEGNFGVFGYVTEGIESVEKLQPGDVIVSAKVVSGQEKLVRPAPAVASAPSPAA